jgi:hypothetical protein
MKRFAAVFQLIALAIILIIPGTALAATYHVPDDYATIQAALDGVAAGDTIIVRDGTYTGASNKNLSFGGKAVTLQSENGPGSTTIDCQNSGRGFIFENSETYDSVVDGLSIINGSVSGNPSWLDNSGGGIRIHQASPLIRNCIISSNSASEFGGGIFSYSGAPAIVDCVISGNTTLGYGGGIRGAFAAFNIIGCEVTGNDAGFGGGISLGVAGVAPGYEYSVFNCLITSNTATTNGGGLQLQSATPGPFPASVANCTVAGNSAGTSGGGMVVNTGAAPVVTDSIFWDNTAPAGPQIAVRDDYQPAWLDIDFSDVAGGQAAVYVGTNATLTWGADNIDTDPLFATGPLGDYYLSQLLAGQASQSPCINAGSALAIGLGLGNTWTRTDGVTDNSTVDMGYHYGPNFGPPVTVYVPDDYATIQAAVDAVSAGSTIIVRDGTYTGAGNKDVTLGERSVTLQSENGPNACIIDCENNGRGFNIDMTWNNAGEVVLDGFTIINGNRSGYGPWYDNSGGGIFIYNGSPTVKNCIISNCFAEQQGGGIMNRSASGLITNCVVTGNTSGSSGGGIKSNYSEPTITDCVITGNDSTAGGGLGLHVTVAGPKGGALVSNCLIVGNTATSGAGIYSNVTDTGLLLATITNCTVTLNSATATAGGLYLQGPSITMTDCIFWNNTAPASPEMYLRDFSVWTSMLEIGYSDVTGGQANIDVDPLSTLTWGAGNIDQDPLFAPGPLGGHYLSQIAAGQGLESPCVNAGSTTAATAGLDAAWTRTDGVADSGTVDIGYHYGASGTPVSCTYSILPENDSVGAGGGSGSINVTAPDPCAWTAVSNDAWITIDSGSPGSGNGTVGYTVAANAGASPRVGSITIETETLTIDQAGSGPGTYYVPDDYATIQAALSAVSAGDTVIVRDGTYTGADNRNLDFGGKDIMLQSENGPANCIIDCQGTGGGFLLWQNETAAAIIEGFTIVNGYFPYGGGIYCANSSPTIRNCVIDSCSAEYGSGVTLWNSTASLTNCTIVRNTSNIGAGGVFLYTSDSTITHCTIADNTAVSGGGIFCYDSSPTLANNILTGNTATYGPQILLGVLSNMAISYSNVEGGAVAAYVEPDCTLNWGAGNIDRNPRFVGAGDYHLPAISPCVDSGTDAGVTSDIDGDARAYGSGFDMGSDECMELPGALTQINLEAPADLASLYASPVFKWVPNGGTNNAFVVDLSIPGLVPLFTSPATTETSWMMPPGIWNVIPAGRQVFWRVRGADLDQTPSNPIASVEQWSFTKQ